MRASTEYCFYLLNKTWRSCSPFESGNTYSNPTLTLNPRVNIQLWALTDHWSDHWNWIVITMCVLHSTCSTEHSFKGALWRKSCVPCVPYQNVLCVSLRTNKHGECMSVFPSSARKHLQRSFFSIIIVFTSRFGCLQVEPSLPSWHTATFLVD